MPTRLCDVAHVLYVDRRYRREQPRLAAELGPRVGELREFVDGDGKVLPRAKYDQVGLLPSPDNVMTVGGYRHFEAVRKIVARAKAEGLPEILFVEDDCVLLPEVDAVAAAARRQLAALGAAPDILYYGANHTTAHTQFVGDNLMKVRGSLTMHCMVIGHRAYDTFLAFRPTSPFDTMIANVIHPHFECFAAWPNVAIQKPGVSVIQGCMTDYTDLFEAKGIDQT